MPFIQRTSVKAADYNASTSPGADGNTTSVPGMKAIGSNGNIDATTTPKVINTGTTGRLIPTYALANPSPNQFVEILYYKTSSSPTVEVDLRSQQNPTGFDECWKAFVGLSGTVNFQYWKADQTGTASAGTPSLGMVNGTLYAVGLKIEGAANNVTLTVTLSSVAGDGTKTPVNFNSGSNVWTVTKADGYAFGTATASYPALTHFYGGAGQVTAFTYSDDQGDVPDAWKYWVRPETSDDGTSLTLSVQEMPSAYQVGDTVEVKVYGMPVGTYQSTSTAGGTLIATLALNQFPYKLTGLTADSYYCYVCAMRLNNGTLRYLSSYATQAKTKLSPLTAEPGNGIYGLSATGTAYHVAHIGHSIVVGSNMAEVATQLAASGRTVTAGAYGVGGATVQDLAPGTANYNTIKTNILNAMAAKPAGTKLVLGLRIAINNVFGSTPANTYLAALQTLINNLQTDLSPVMIVVLGDPFYWGMSPSAFKNIQTSKTSNDLMESYRTGAGSLTGVYAVRSAYVRNLSSQHYEWTTDGVHLGGTGSPNTVVARADASEWKTNIEAYEASLAPPLTGINLTHGNANGQGQYQWTATPVPSNASLSGLMWSISAGDGSIDQSGLQSPRVSHPAPYTATVTATVGSVQGQGTITVPGTDTVAPSIVSVTIAEDGLSAAIVLNEAVTGSTGFTFNVAGTARTATVTGSGATRTAAFSGTTPIYMGQAVTFGYSGDGLTDAGGNHPATVIGAAATNNSTQSTTGTVSSVTIDPPGPVTLEAGGSQQFAAVVAGTGNFDPTKVWSKLSGVGTVNSSGLYTAPTSESEADREAVLKCASVADPTKFDTVTVLIPGVDVEAPPTSGVQLVTLPLAVNVQGPLNLTAGDTGPARFVQLTDGNNQPLVLPDGAVVTYRLKARSGDIISGAAVVVLGMLGYVRYDWAVPVPEPGTYREQWKVQMPGGQVVHVPSDGYVTLRVLPPL